MSTFVVGHPVGKIGLGREGIGEGESGSGGGAAAGRGGSIDDGVAGSLDVIAGPPRRSHLDDGMEAGQVSCKCCNKKEQPVHGLNFI